MVIKRGMNEDSILPMARHFRGTRPHVRFIEYMDVGTTNGWRLDDACPSEIVERIGAEFLLEADLGLSRRGRGAGLTPTAAARSA